MTTTIIFLIVLTVLVFIHELGHFLAARLFGVRVDEFAIGFPPRLFSWMWGKTRYAINLLPLGGYVRIYGENPDDDHGQITDTKTLPPDSMLAKPRWQQVIILLAGIFFNLVLAWILFTIAFTLGTKASVENIPKSAVKDSAITISFVSPGSPAAKANIVMGDQIMALSDGVATYKKEELSVEKVRSIIASSTKPLSFELRHLEIGQTDFKEGDVRTVVVESVQTNPEGRKMIGIAMDEVGTIQFGFFDSVAHSAKQTIAMSKAVVVGLYELIKNALVGKGDMDQLTGPVGIAGVVGQSARLGFDRLLTVMAVISINLAVLNLAPFPALDGGRVVVVIIESIIRRPLPSKIIQWINAAGFLLLIGLTLVITYKDILKLFK
jgi:regulator of sigma E protease